MFPSNLVEACLRKVRFVMAMICFYIKTVSDLYQIICLYFLSSIKQFTPRVFLQECILVSTIQLSPVNSVRFLSLFYCITVTGTSCLSCLPQCPLCCFICIIFIVDVNIIVTLSVHHLIDHYYYPCRCHSTSARHHRWGKFFWSVGLLCGLWPHSGQDGH